MKKQDRHSTSFPRRRESKLEKESYISLDSRLRGNDVASGANL
jgi:hypothetical protein